MDSSGLLEDRWADAALDRPLDLASAVARHAPERPAFTDLGTRRSITFGGLRDAAARAAGRLRGLRVGRGDAVVFFAAGGYDLLPLLLACERLGARLVASSADLPRPAAAAVIEQCRPKVAVFPPGKHERWNLGRADLQAFTLADWLREDGGAAPRDPGGGGAPGSPDEPCLVVHTSGTTGPAKPVLLTPAGLVAMARSFRYACPLGGGDTLFAASPLRTASGLAASGVIPMLIGAHAVLADGAALADLRSCWAAVDRAEATACEFPAWRLRSLLDDAGSAAERVPRRLRFLLCSGGGLSREQHDAAEEVWGRRVFQGYGTAETGYWAAATPGGAGLPGRGCPLAPSAGVEVLLRPLRAPLAAPRGALPGGGDDGRAPAIGEILVRGAAVTPGYHRKNNLTHVAFEGGYFRTGDIGTLDADGGLSVLGRCKEHLVRKGTGILLGDIDAVLRSHPAVADSKTIRDAAGGEGERITSVCVAAEPVPDLGAWLAERVGAAWLPDRFVFAPALPRGLGGEVSADALRSVLDLSLRDEVVEALTARRFRRNPPFKEDALRALVQDAVLGRGPLDFVMLWGCGPRAAAAEPEFAALAALAELLDAACPAAWMRARAEIVFTDVHAEANGHSPEHRAAYFGAVERAAAGLDVSFERESRVWRSRGLDAGQVRRFAASAELDEEWRRFPLRERFVEQAGRHSRAADREAAAKHYFATCRLERLAFAAAYPRSVFLTYNGPEFNGCFPDLPTLYIFPGPRGKTVKPWFD